MQTIGARHERCNCLSLICADSDSLFCETSSEDNVQRTCLRSVLEKCAQFRARSASKCVVMPSQKDTHSFEDHVQRTCLRCVLEKCAQFRARSASKCV